MARSILVAGAAGFIGSNFVRWWLERHRDDHVVALDRLTYAGDPRNLDGLGVRLAVADICDLEPGREGETYNVGSGLERSIEEIAVLVLDLAGKPRSLKTIVPDRPGHDRRYLLDSGKLRRELGWEPEISFEDGPRATVEWYAANHSWWEPLRDRAPVPESQWS